MGGDLRRESGLRYGLRVTSLRGAIVYETRPANPGVLVSPLQALLGELLREEDVVQVHAPDLAYDREWVFRGKAFPATALGYKNGFFVGAKEQSLILPAGVRGDFLGALGWLNGQDAWCAYLVDDAQGARRVRDLLLRQVPSDPPQLQGREEGWLREVLSVCNAVVCPGGDGAFVDVWTVAGDPPGLEEAIGKANLQLAALGPLRFDDDLNSYVIEG